MHAQMDKQAKVYVYMCSRLALCKHMARTRTNAGSLFGSPSMVARGVKEFPSFVHFRWPYAMAMRFALVCTGYGEVALDALSLPGGLWHDPLSCGFSFL